MQRKRIVSIVAASLFCCLFALTPALAAVDLPDKLKSVPLFPNSTVQQSMDMGNAVMATAVVKSAKLDAVADFYKGKMKEKGWKISLQAQQENVQMIQFQKDNQMLHVQVQAEDDEITYNMVLQSN